MKKKQTKPHWYFTTHFHCPVCSAGSSVRVRRYGRKPKVMASRHEFIVSYDNCMP